MVASMTWRSLTACSLLLAVVLCGGMVLAEQFNLAEIEQEKASQVCEQALDRLAQGLNTPTDMGALVRASLLQCPGPPALPCIEEMSALISSLSSEPQSLAPFLPKQDSTELLCVYRI